MLEALSQELCSGVTWEDLFADDLVIIADSLTECVKRSLILVCKNYMEKWLRVNDGTTKVMIC